MIIEISDTSSVYGGKCMICKWLNDKIGKPVFEDGGRAVVKGGKAIVEGVGVLGTLLALIPRNKEEK